MNDIETKTPTLPGDEQGRSWVQANWQDEKDSALTQRALGTLISTDENDELWILGSAFVVLAADETALCLGATHSFDEVKRLQRGRSARGFAGVAADLLPLALT